MLSPAQARCIAALLVERTDKAAALVANVAYPTLRRWLKDADFQAALSTEQSKVVDVVVNRITAAADILSKRALEIADNPNLEIADLIKLIQFILPYSIELHDRQALLQRIADIEKASARPNDPWVVIEGNTKCLS